MPKKPRAQGSFLSFGMVDRFELLVITLLLCSFCALPSWGSEVPRKPKVRAITAFIRIERTHYLEQVQQALAMLRQAKAMFEKTGYDVQTIRITTQPFPQYIRGLSKKEALAFFKTLEDLSKKESFILNIGPAMLSDEDDRSQIELLGEILAASDVYSSVIVAGDDGIHWRSISAAAKLIKYLEEHSPQGTRNFNFAATAGLRPYAPFYPGSYHNNAGHEFSVGLEGGNFVADVFAGAHGDFTQARERLSQ